MFQALYRQMRPLSFAGIVGQDAIVRTLQNQVKNGRVSHAYLFCGTRGTGKTSTAKVLARAAACVNPQDGEPCDECDSCRSILADASLDVLEIDAASNNGVDNIRDIRDNVVFPPVVGRRKVYIVDEVHMLSSGAFNALLKTLEEPPGHAVFILATTEPQKLPATIVSRCQRFDFRRIRVEDIRAYLAQACERVGASCEPEALEMIARAGEGAMRDALSVLDLCIAAGGGNVSVETAKMCLGTAGADFLYEFAQGLAEGELGTCLRMTDELVQAGRDVAVFARDLAEHMRRLMVCLSCGGDAAEILQITKAEAQRMSAQAKAMGGRALRAMEALGKAEQQMRLSTQPRVVLELALARICRPEADDAPEALQERVAQLEKALREGNFTPAQQKSAPSPAPKAEKSAPAPAPKQTASPSGFKWQDFLQGIKKEHVKLYFSLKLAAFLGFEGDKAKISFPPEQRIHAQSCQKDENRQAIETTLSKMLGKAVSADIVCGEPQTPPPPKVDTEALEALFGRDKIELI